MRNSPGPSARGRLQGIVLSLVTGVVVLAFTGTMVLLEQHSLDREVEGQLTLQSHAVVASIQAGIEDIVIRLTALDGLYQSSEVVTPSEYADFVAGLGPTPGMGGMAYMPVVFASGLAAFADHAEQTIPGFTLFEIDEDGDRVALGDREVYFPVQMFEPADALGQPLGLDAGSPPGRFPYLVAATKTEGTVATPLYPLATTGQKGFVLLRSVRDATGTVEAVVGIPVVLDDLTAGRVPAIFSGSLNWTIRDVTEQVAGSTTGTPPDLHDTILTPTWDGLAHTEVVAVLDRVWQFDVAPAPGSSLLDVPYQPRRILIAGLIGAFLLGAIVYAYDQRRRADDEMRTLQDLLLEKDQFLASVSHELRTPLTSVVAYAELLRDEGARFSTGEQSEMVADIAHGATDVANIVDDLLVVGRAQSHNLFVAAVPVDLGAQVAQVLETLELADQIPVETTPPGAMAVADPPRVRQIIRNLITNAVAYGGPNIEVAVETIEDRMVVKVVDDGAGVPPEHAEEIFDMYHNVQTDPGNPGSLGLGLAVARALAERMGGDISYRRIDDKTIFQLALPVAVPPPIGAAPGTPHETENPQHASTLSGVSTQHSPIDHPSLR